MDGFTPRVHGIEPSAQPDVRSALFALGPRKILTHSMRHAAAIARREAEYRRNRAHAVKARRAVANGYTMRGCDEQRLFFVHIPKAAGISVNEALFGGLGAGHATVTQYQRLFGPLFFSRAYSFTFVREPVVRLKSAFRFLKTGGMNAHDREFAERNLRGIDSFEAFVLDWLDAGRIQSGIHLKPQWEFLCPVYPFIAVDFVGRYENIDADFAHVARQLKRNVSLPHANRTPASAPTAEISPDVRRKVENLYDWDYKLLGYPKTG